MVEFCDIQKKDTVANLLKTRSAFNSAAFAQVIDNGGHSVNLGLMPNKRRYVKTIADAVRRGVICKSEKPVVLALATAAAAVAAGARCEASCGHQCSWSSSQCLQKMMTTV